MSVSFAPAWRIFLAGIVLALAACGGGDLAEDVVAKADVSTFRGNGIWWNEKEPGSGFFVEAQGATMVATFFTYDAGGFPRWYNASGELKATADGAGLQLSAALLSYTGGAEIHKAARKPTSTVAGTVSIAFHGESAEVRVPGRTFTATKFNREGRFTPPTATQPQTGIWWDPSRDGSGFAVDVADNRATVAIFDYDFEGKSNWRLGAVPVGDQTRPAKAEFSWYFGGQPLAGAYKAPKAQSLGSMDAQFGDVCIAAFVFPSSTSEPTSLIARRFDFGGLRGCPGYASGSAAVTLGPQLTALLQEKSAQGYRPIYGSLFRRESELALVTELVDLDENALSFETRDALIRAMGERGFRYLSHMDLIRFAAFVKSPTGAVYTYRLMRTPKAGISRGDFLAEANALGAEGFLHMLGTTVDERLYMKDSQSKARYVYEAQPAPAIQAAFREQVQAQGLRGFRFKAAGMDGQGNYMLYEKDATQSAVFSHVVHVYWAGYLPRADAEAARGNRFLGRFYLTLGDTWGGYELFYRASNCTGILCEVHQQRW